MTPNLFPSWSFYAMPWLLGGATALAARILGKRGLQPWGIGLMTVPLWDTLWGIADSFGPLLAGGQVLRPYSRFELSGLYEVKFLGDLGELACGFLLYAGRTAPDLLRQSPRRLAAALRDAGLPLGALPKGRWGEGRSAFAGLLLFPLLLLMTLLVDAVLSGVRSLNQSDESSVFANMTPYHALAISLAAGFGEELLYRGLVLAGLVRFFGPRWMPAAIALQAALFGFAHSGYGTWTHVLTPALFGLVAGLVAWAYGIWASILLHVLVDVFAFGAEVARHAAWANATLSLFLLANGLLTVAWSLRWLLRRFLQPGAPPEPPAMT